MDNKEIFDEDSDGEFEDEVQEEAPKVIEENIFNKNRPLLPSELIDIAKSKDEPQKRGRKPGSLNKNHEYKRKKFEREEAIKKLWKLGKLHWKLDSLQKQLYDAYYSKSRGKFIWSVSRQTGKSWTVCTIALEEAIRTPGIRMAYIAPELNDAKDITEQTFDQLCEDAPAEFRPKFNSMKNRWEWQNGSILKVTGTDNKNYNKIRGRKFDIIFLDEFCFMDEFKKVFFSCVKPTTTSVPNYKIIFISTPPETPDHESNMILDDAEEDGSLIKKTIYDSPRFSAEFIEENILKDYRSLGGKNSIEFRREYMCLDEFTPIKTSEGMKYIKDIQVGDYVWTHKGRYKKVLSVFKNKLDNRPVYRIKCNNNDGFICTEGHELYITKTNHTRDLLQGKTEWTKIEEVSSRPSERIYFNVPIEKRFDAEMTKDLAYISGWFVAEGHTSNDCQQTVLSLSKKDPIDEINRCSLAVFGKEFKLYQEIGGSVQYGLNSKIAKSYFNSFGKGAKNKKVINDIKNSSIECKLSFLKAYFEGDGCVLDYKNSMEVCSVSKLLLFDISDILNSLDIPNTLINVRHAQKGTILGRNVNFSDQYRITVTGKSYIKLLELFYGEKKDIIIHSQRHKIINDILYSRITSIEKIDYNKEFVYDIEVEEDHSYTNPFATFHNCERIADSSKLVIPEANKEKIIEITAVLPRPEFYNIYEAFDWGVKDSNGGLFAYINFETQQLIIEEELLYHDSTSTTYDIAKKIIKAEQDTWTDERRSKIQRFADNNLQIINDMSLNFNLYMIPTSKDNLAAQVQKVRHLLSNGQIIINPKCVNLIEQIQSAQWNSSRKSFVRRNGHHYDLVAALIYLVRNCQLEVSPFPVNYHLRKFDKESSFIGKNNIEGNEKLDEFSKFLASKFSIKRKR